QNISSTIAKAGRSGRSNRCLRLLRLLIVLVGVGLGTKVSLDGLQEGYNRFVSFVLQRIVHVLIDITRGYCIFVLLISRLPSYPPVAPTVLRMRGEPPPPLFLCFDHKRSPFVSTKNELPQTNASSGTECTCVRDYYRLIEMNFAGKNYCGRP